LLHGKSGLIGRDEIIKLRYQDIVEWYPKVFNPSNLLIMSHGDLHPIKLIHNFRK
jgi:Zn-dependent M16 (insulinase) family peptidase